MQKAYPTMGSLTVSPQHLSGDPMGYKSGDEWTGNAAGRPKGIKNRKTLLREEMERDGSALLAAIKEKALGGDTSAQPLWLARLEPVARPRAAPVEFDLDTTLSAAGQIEQIIKAVAEGALTIDEGQLICNMIRQRAEVIALARCRRQCCAGRGSSAGIRRRS